MSLLPSKKLENYTLYNVLSSPISNSRARMLMPRRDGRELEELGFIGTGPLLAPPSTCTGPPRSDPPCRSSPPWLHVIHARRLTLRSPFLPIRHRRPRPRLAQVICLFRSLRFWWIVVVCFGSRMFEVICWGKRKKLRETHNFWWKIPHKSIVDPNKALGCVWIKDLLRENKIQGIFVSKFAVLPFPSHSLSTNHSTISWSKYSLTRLLFDL